MGFRFLALPVVGVPVVALHSVPESDVKTSKWFGILANIRYANRTSRERNDPSHRPSPTTLIWRRNRRPRHLRRTTIPPPTLILPRQAVLRL